MLVGLVAWLSLLAAPAMAEDKTAARDHWERGTKFYDLGKYEEAIMEFEAAYEAKSDPAFLYNLAQSHRLAGHPADALRFYRTYLRYVPKAPNRGDIEQRIAELEKIGAARPAAEPPPTLPPPVGPATTPGSVESTSPGPVAETAPAPVTPPPVSPSGAGMTAPATAPVSPPDEPTSGRRKTAMVVAAAGAGVFVVGAVFGLVARSQSNKVEEAARNMGTFDPDAESLGNTSETLQWVGYGIGLAAIATGVILYVTAPRSEAAAVPRVALAPLVSPSSGGALLRVTF